MHRDHRELHVLTQTFPTRRSSELPPVTSSERRLGQLGHRGLADGPSTGDANRELSSTGLNDYLCHGVCHTGEIQEIARSLIVGPHSAVVSSPELYLEAFPPKNK